jgi:hypothetical protein
MQSDETTTRFKASSIPRINQRIRINISEKKFDKTSAKKYYQTFTNHGIPLKMDDSLNSQSTYLSISIADKVSWLSELNDAQNIDIVSYLRTTEKPILISMVQVYLPQDIHKDLMSADEVYLINNERKGYLLELYREQDYTKNVDLNTGIVFDLNSKEFCWSENSKHQIIISDISETGCNKPMSISYQKALKKKSDYNF